MQTIWPQYLNITDEQTDSRLVLVIPPLCVASRGNKWRIFASSRHVIDYCYSVNEQIARSDDVDASIRLFLLSIAYAPNPLNRIQGVQPGSTGVNAAGSQGFGPPIFDPRGPSMCWTLAVIRMQSRVRCTIFVNIIDCVVSAVIEQVYSTRPTLKFCLLKIQEICPLKRFIFTSICTKMRLVAGLRPNPLGELTANWAKLPQTP